MDYIYIVNKPKGWTSNDVVQKIKYHFHYKKVGHGGTLDPNATGVLVVGYNEGTKQLGKLIIDDKEYIADIKFGAETDSYDVCGKVVQQLSYNHITLDSINIVLNDFKNKDYYQTPPIFSAKKINGQKLYELARQHKTIPKIEPQKVKLINFKILDFHDGLLKLHLEVSKGFYVRSLAHDLGLKLNSCAMLNDLQRTRSGIFTIAQSITIDELLKDN